MTLSSIGDMVQQGTYRVHSRFCRVVNLWNGRCLVSVVEEKIGAGPVNVVMTGVDLSRVHSLSVDQGTLTLNGWRSLIDPRRYYDSGVDVDGGMSATLNKNLTLLGRLLAEASPPRSLGVLLDRRRMALLRPGFESNMMSRLAEGVDRILQRDLIAGILILRGCGFGLTPSGDDFIAGLLLAAHVLQRIHDVDLRDTVDTVYELSRSGNVLSDTSLSLAREGRLTERTKNLVAAVLHGTEDQVHKCVRQLLLVGETSGADLGTGLYLTMRFGRVFLQSAHCCESVGALPVREREPRWS